MNHDLLNALECAQSRIDQLRMDLLFPDEASDPVMDRGLNALPSGPVSTKWLQAMSQLEMAHLLMVEALEIAKHRGENT
jgi:hypothetical protein